MQITLVTRKFRNGQRNVHCDAVHITTKWVFGLTLDCNGVFAIKAYYSSIDEMSQVGTDLHTGSVEVNIILCKSGNVCTRRPTCT